ncbi:transposase [Roseateles sp.]|uniref:transposase n=1 Tax=Roseateles sp. TaxID=1971397 RepID=UPI003BA94456
MLDGILAKLCTGIPWRDVAYKVGTFSTALRQLASWRRSGKWDTVVRVILARNTDISDLGPRAVFSHDDAISSYQPLSDEEWDGLRELGLSHHKNRKYDLRESVDVILQRELAGQPWNHRWYGTPLEKAAYQLAYSWRSTGRLVQIVEAVRRMREA